MNGQWSMMSARQITRIVAIMSLLSCLLGGCGEEEAGRPASSSTPPPASAAGWIRVDNGTPELIKRAVVAHAESFRKVKPQRFRVSVAKHPSGFFVVTFPDGVRPYDLVNLIGWLDQPPDITGVSGATGWITSPATGVTYSLRPDAENSWGDTLIGTSSDGKAVQVYQPEVSMCEISRRVIPVPEPDLSQAQTDSLPTFTVTLDVDPSFGNPEFKMTHPKDTNWNK